MHLDVELRKNDIIRIKDQVIMNIYDDLKIVIDRESRLRLIEETKNWVDDRSWWCCLLKHPELRVRIREENIAWVERH